MIGSMQKYSTSSQDGERRGRVQEEDTSTDYFNKGKNLGTTKTLYK